MIWTIAAFVGCGGPDATSPDEGQPQAEVAAADVRQPVASNPPAPAQTPLPKGAFQIAYQHNMDGEIEPCG